MGIISGLKKAVGSELLGGFINVRYFCAFNIKRFTMMEKNEKNIKYFKSQSSAVRNLAYLFLEYPDEMVELMEKSKMCNG